MELMRDYGKVHTSYWTSATIRELSEDGRTLAMYLLTCPHGTIAGVFRLPDGYACEDLQWATQRVQQGFDELLSNGFANRCETTKWVWITKHLEWNPPENPNQRKAATKVASQIPEQCGWKLDFIRVCGHLLGIEQPEKINPFGTLPKPFLNQEQEQEQDIGVPGGKPPASADAPPDGDAAAPPAKPNAGDKKIELPDWMPAEQWADFVAMRRQKGKRAPFTVAAAKGIVSDLGKLRERGQDVADVLHQSVVNGWSGVFPVNDARRAATPQNSAIGAFV